eukprot:7276372-Prymnesium_polylepis.2
MRRLDPCLQLPAHPCRMAGVRSWPLPQQSSCCASRHRLRRMWGPCSLPSGHAQPRLPAVLVSVDYSCAVTGSPAHHFISMQTFTTFIIVGPRRAAACTALRLERRATPQAVCNMVAGVEPD